MDVRCERCKTEYEFDEAKVPEAGVTVKCTSCGNVFKVYRVQPPAPAPVARPAPAAPPPAEVREWKVRRAGAEFLKFRELTTLQKWIVERKVSKDDEISLSGENWKRLSNIPELASFFEVVEQAERAAHLEALHAKLATGPATPSSVPSPRPGPGAQAVPLPGSPPSLRVPVVNFPAAPPAATKREPTTAESPFPPPPPGEPALPQGRTPVFTPFDAPPTFTMGPEIKDETPRFGSPTSADISPAAENLNPRLPDPPVIFHDEEDLRPPRRSASAMAVPLVGVLLLAGAAVGYFKVYLPQQRERQTPMATAPATVDAGLLATAETPDAGMLAAADAPDAGALAEAELPDAGELAAAGPPDAGPASVAVAEATAPATLTPLAVAPKPRTKKHPVAPPAATPAANVTPVADPPPAVDAGADAPATPAIPSPEDAPVDAGASASTPSAPAPDAGTAEAAPKSAAAASHGHDFAYFMAQGDRARERDHAQQALEAYAHAAALGPGRVEAVAGRGLALLDLGKREQAVSTFQRALEMDPANGVALMGLAETYRSLSLKADAIKFYERYLELQPNGSEAAVARSAVEKLKE